MSSSVLIPQSSVLTPSSCRHKLFPRQIQPSGDAANLFAFFVEEGFVGLGHGKEGLQKLHPFVALGDGFEAVNQLVIIQSFLRFGDGDFGDGFFGEDSDPESCGFSPGFDGLSPSDSDF